MIDYEKMDEKKTLRISLFVVAIVAVSVILQILAKSEIEQFGINFITFIVVVLFFSSLLILTRMKGRKESGKE